MAFREEAGLNVDVEPIDNFVLSGMQRKMRQVFRCDAILEQSSDRKRVLAALKARRGGLEYPYMFLRVTALAENENYNSKATIINGAIVSLTEDKKAYRTHFLPVIQTVECTYITNTAKGVHKFAADWLFSRKAGWLPFTVTYGKSSFNVRLSLDGSVSLPVREAGLDNTQEYQVTTSMQCQGYISKSELVETHIVTGTEIVGVLADSNDNTEARIRDAQRDEQKHFWTFRHLDGEVTETDGPASTGEPIGNT